MALSPGTRLGVYENTTKIGEGGMGEVYRARDTTLDRDVALKVLHEAFTSDPDRLARFEREAKLLASLNHPNIGGIYGLEEWDGGTSRALVLELVEGPTLADRIAQGPIPIDEALPIATQIAEALEAAHEQGVIHRDLKPANIKVRPDGTVKVLDFGLAKALDTAPEGDPNLSPTLTAAATQMGVILGTAAYMSPEQARGKVVDRRADIWAFGAVLYEMLTGQRAFQGDDVSTTLADVIRAEPAWAALPDGLPSGLGTYLRRCLEKDPRQRVRDIGDVRLALAGVFEAPASPSAGAVRAVAWRERLAWGVLTAGLVAIVLLTSFGQDAAPVGESVRLSMLADQDVRVGSYAVSPDGRDVVYVATDTDGVRQLWVRSLTTGRSVRLDGTEGAQYPFWSPDGQSVGFFAGGVVRKIGAGGGAVQTLCDAPAQPRGGTWSRDGEIIFAGNVGPLHRVSSSGGVATEIDMSMLTSAARFQWPSFLPDGRHYFFTAWPTAGGREVYIGSLDDPSDSRLLISTEFASRAEYSEPGYVVYRGADGLLFAREFDAQSLTVEGEPVPVGPDRVANPASWSAFSAPSIDVLMYTSDTSEQAETSESRLLWVDREGEIVGGTGVPGIWTLRVSPDGSRVAANAGGGDIWIFDAEGGAGTRFTTDPDMDARPTWSSDGQRVAFFSTRRGVREVYVKAVDATTPAELLVSESEAGLEPRGWSPDDRFLALDRIGPQSNGVWVYSFEDGEARPFIDTPFNESDGEFSPDGQWLAYSSDEAGELDIYVRPFPGPGPAQRISPGGGRHPRWREDGTELFYVAPGGQLLSVSIGLEGDRLVAREAVELFQMQMSAAGRENAPFDVAPDGERFLVRPREGAQVFTVVLNWSRELLERVQMP